MVRLEDDDFAVLDAVRRLTGNTAQALLEPVIVDWLDEHWRDHPAIAAFLTARQLLEATESGKPVDRPSKVTKLRRTSGQPDMD